MALKSLEEHNAERRYWHGAPHQKEPMANGIACPECGAEMVDTAPGVSLTTDPPQKHVGCNGCGYRGYAVT
jgi:hypothetical protein